jgi:hypothetical protein
MSFFANDDCWFFLNRQVAEEEGLITNASELDSEPYFVDFLRDAPEMTGEFDMTAF